LDDDGGDDEAATTKETPRDDDDDEPDWLRDYDAKKRKTDADEVERRRGKIREEMRERAKRAETRATLRRDAEERLRRKIAESNASESRREVDEHTAEEREFLADEYDSGAEHAAEDLRTLLKADEDDSDDDNFAAAEEDEALRPAQQVILCSRTHSQLTQVIGELRNTAFGGKVAGAEEQVAASAVASRAQLCVNPAVRNLGSAARINERCLEMSKGKTKPGEKTKLKACPFLSKRRGAMLELKEAALAKPMDIEDLVRLGETRRACPYYAARSALPEADLVLMPYASLLHADTREILGIRLENAVVIFDEAHNLVDAVHSSYGAAVTLEQLRDVDDMLTAYVDRFKTRLSANNLRYLKTLANITRAFMKTLAKESRDDSKPEKRLTSLNDFLFECGQDTVNMFSLRKYLKESKVAHKIASYGERVRAQDEGVHASVETIGNKTVAVVPDPNATPRLGAVHALTSLIDCLASADSDGRIIYERESSNGDPAALRFILLDAASRFKRVVEQARSVILVGGTLAPIDELVTQLCPDLKTLQSSPENDVNRRLMTFTCGHIIPRDNLLPVALPAGPTGTPFDFTHAARSDVKVMDELGRVVVNACRVAPGGVCVFFPSFKYADDVYERWATTGTLSSVRGTKDVYREPRDASALEKCLRDYAASVKRGLETNARSGGAVLLCVVGGKLSEGINFKDELGRLVVMVGLPYANVGDAELRARMDHLDEGAGNQGRGRAYYEALCMRGVNQSVGRAIRHVGDYACIVLCDKRWGAFGSAQEQRTKAAKGLPEWIEQRLIVPERNYGEVHARIARFFRARDAR